MRVQLLLLLVTFSLADEVIQYKDPTDDTNCYTLDTCVKCLSDTSGICAWYDYTQSCENIDSGLPLSNTCSDYVAKDDPCSQYTECSSCVIYEGRNNTCGWNGTHCMWWKSVSPPLSLSLNVCPYNSSRVFPRLSSLFESNLWMVYRSIKGWGSYETTKNASHCPYDPSKDLCVPLTQKGCTTCLWAPLTDDIYCEWNLLDNRCLQSNYDNVTEPVTNFAQCPWGPHIEDPCATVEGADSCFTCIRVDGFTPYCGWLPGNNTCVSLNSHLPSLIIDPNQCPYLPKNDKCRDDHHSQCFEALTKGKGTCGFMLLNNTAVSLAMFNNSNPPHNSILTDALQCPDAGADPCEGQYLSVMEMNCQVCVQLIECGWYPQNQSCHGLHKKHLPLVKHCVSGCDNITNCRDCARYKPEEYTCSWSYLNNTCLPSRDNFYLHQFPDIASTKRTPTDPSVALTCGDVRDDCSEENMSHYLCEDDSMYDFKWCYPGSVFQHSACAAGFMRVIKNTTDFWGGRNVTEETIRCCPGYYCPQNKVCAVKCAAGNYCPRSIANYTVQRSDLDYYKKHPPMCHPYLPILPSPQLGCGGAPLGQLCRAGHYCPNTTSEWVESAQKIPMYHRLICPENHFCRQAVTSPTRCYPPPLYYLLYVFLSCPEGSSHPQARLILILLIAGIFFLYPLVTKLIKWIKARFAKKVGETDGHLPLKTNYGTVPPDYDISTIYNEPVSPVDIIFYDLGYTLSDGNTILHQMSGTFSAGKFTAIMGPSGCGKTTLMFSIMGKLGDRSEGTVQPDIRSLRSIVGFVPQEDIMHRELTVLENIKFSAQYRQVRGISKHKLNEATITILGLSAVRNIIIGDDFQRGVSGGQRKRVNIGMEVVNAPSVLFLDEPTSGLDSSMSLELCHTLKSLTRMNVNVITVIHQPRYDIFDQFDDIILLKKGGTLIYNGPKEEVMDFLEQHGFVPQHFQNPCDYILDVISDPNFQAVPRSKLVDRSQISALSALTTDRQNTHPLWQVWYIIMRTILQNYRQMSTLQGDIGLSMVAGIIVGLIYRNPTEIQIPQASFLLVLVSSLTSMVLSLRLFGLEKSVYWRENASGMNGVSYFFGKNFASFPSYALTAGIFLVFYYILSVPRATFAIYLAILIVNHFCISGLAHFLSILMTPHTSQLTGVVVIMVQCCAGGFSPTLSDLRQISVVLYWVSFTLPSRWTMEALSIVNLEALTAAQEDIQETLLKKFGYNLNFLGVCFGSLIAMGIFWRLCTLLAILFANHLFRSQLNPFDTNTGSHNGEEPVVECKRRIILLSSLKEQLPPTLSGACTAISGMFCDILELLNCSAVLHPNATPRISLAEYSQLFRRLLGLPSPKLNQRVTNLSTSQVPKPHWSIRQRQNELRQKKSPFVRKCKRNSVPHSQERGFEYFGASWLSRGKKVHKSDGDSESDRESLNSEEEEDCDNRFPSFDVGIILTPYSCSSQPTESVPGSFSSPRKSAAGSAPHTPAGSSHIVRTITLSDTTESSVVRRLNLSESEVEEELQDEDSAEESEEDEIDVAETEKTEKVCIISDDDDFVKKKPVLARKSSLASPKKTPSKSEETKEEKKERLKRTEQEIKRRREEREKKETNKSEEKETKKRKKEEEKEEKKKKKEEEKEEKKKEMDKKKMEKKVAEKKEPKKRATTSKKKVEAQKAKEKKEYEAKINIQVAKKQKKMEDSSSSSEEEAENNEEGYVHNPTGLAHGGRRRKTWEDQARFARIDFGRSNEMKERSKLTNIFSSPFAIMSETVAEDSTPKKKSRVQNKTKIPAVIDSLQTMCLKLLVQYIDCVESFGLLPPSLQDGMCALLARHSKFTPDVLDLFLEPDMTVLHLSNCSELDPKTLATVARCKQLEKLTIAGCGKLTNEALVTIAEHCPTIRDLRLDGCYGIGDESLIKVAQTHPKLESLTLGWIEKFTSDFTEALGTGCPQLRTLGFIQCVNMNDVMLSPLGFLNHLESLTLEGIPQVSDAGVKNMMQASMTNMKRLSIVRCEGLSGNGVVDMISMCPNLTSIVLEDITEMDDSHLQQISLVCTNLETFRISGCPSFEDASMTQLVQNNPTLVRLGVCKNPKIGMKTVEEMCKSCPKLQELDLSWSRATDDFVVDHLLKHSHRLRKITLWGCSRVTDVAVRVMLRHGLEVIGKDQFTLAL
ncbi:abc transporter aaa ATPase [Planoprotostelium fungivorum]|uniref:Abc transporter aaa ATPase n=1 Tax=Planoprotostelium fungivorum TaxID=1890364 RepID=A0A2P6N535_9EUKA|nr:abc transporter aaa ATPase [Planoprotostelium fungivorum]